MFFDDFKKMLRIIRKKTPMKVTIIRKYGFTMAISTIEPTIVSIIWKRRDQLLVYHLITVPKSPMERQSKKLRSASCNNTNENEKKVGISFPIDIFGEKNFSTIHYD